MAGARSSSSSIRRPGRPERGSLSLNVHEELDQGEENQRVMEAHFNEVCMYFIYITINDCFYLICCKGGDVFPFIGFPVAQADILF